jgi:hypothetical protein
MLCKESGELCLNQLSGMHLIQQGMVRHAFAECRDRKPYLGDEVRRFQRSARQNTSVRTSMLSHAGASDGLVGSSNPECAEKRARPSLLES